ncbi:MAG: Gfo/Idh/MocA family oxidoreductase [Acidobacteria bacterium]|nr:Gfo/Idh/MocA family oxidoreductase [Acidobacteriota bacterium]MCI0623101.1 Gfo/Idh/MocA family oxidoreductase [Acidobacteriota bacterium]MCI0717941.1 Gfo/Idh/MocA family oxidoreductase [Acidobacteriota bacterium]
MTKKIAVLASLVLWTIAPLATAESPQPIRVGLIGLDTSHVIAFTKLLNDSSNPDHVPGARVVAAFKGGSPDIESSRTRIEGFTAELRDKWKVEIVADIATLCRKVDAVLLESVDGRPHLEQVKPVLAAKKPVFIDKPLAASYRDAREIARLAREAGVPWFSSSSLRFWDETRRLKSAAAAGRILGSNVYGPAPTEPHHPDLMWYGIHAVEMLFTLMGPGCESVTRVNTEGTDIVTGKWKDGRLGVVRGIRKGKQDYGIALFGEKAILHSESKPSGYRPLLVEIVKFFQTGVAPVNPDETLEMFAFMEAADESKAKGGVAVSLTR